MANPSQPPSFKTDVNRAPTKRWVDAKSYTYDGDDWGSYDEFEDVERPAPPPKLTGLGLGGQSLSTRAETPANPSNLERTLNLAAARWQPSNVEGDEQRDFSPGTVPQLQRRGDHMDLNYGHPSASNTSPFIQRQDIRAPDQNSPLSLQNQDLPVKLGFVSPWSQKLMDVNANNHRPSQSRSSSTTSTSRSSADPLTRRDFSPSALPPPLQTRASPAPPGNNNQGARLPPRKSSPSQQRPPVVPGMVRGSQASVAQINEPMAQSPAVAEARAPLFTRPADIYRRMAEEKEKERGSMDLNRRSMDSMSEQRRDRSSVAGSTQTPGNSDSPVRDLQRRIDQDKSADQESASRLKPLSRPLAERQSEYGLERFTLPDAPLDRPTDVTTILSDAHPTLPSPATTSATAPSLPKLNRVSGFGTDLWGFTEPNTEGAPRVPSMGQNQASTFLPMTMHDSGSAIKSQDRFNAGNASVVEQVFDGPNARGILLTQMSGSQRSATGSELSRSGTESTTDISPIMSRVPSAATATKRAQEHGQIHSTPVITEDIRESGSSNSRPTSNGTLRASSPAAEYGPPMHSPYHSAESDAPSVNPGHRGDLYSPSPSCSPARTPTIETVNVASPTYDRNAYPNSVRDSGSNSASRELDVTSRVQSSPEPADTGEDAAKTAQATFLQSRSDSLAAADARLPEPDRVGSNTISRSVSPGTGKGRVRDLASRFNEIGQSRSNSVQSPTSSISSWSSGNKRSMSPEKGMATQGCDTSGVPRTDNVERSRHGDALAMTGGFSQPQVPVVQRPKIPGGWISEVDTASSNIFGHDRNLVDIPETMNGLEIRPGLEEGLRTPTMTMPAGEKDRTSTITKMPLQSRYSERPDDSPATATIAGSALSDSVVASARIMPKNLETEANNAARTQHSDSYNLQDRPIYDRAINTLPLSGESLLAAPVVTPVAQYKGATIIQQSSQASGYSPPSHLTEYGGQNDTLYYERHGQQERGAPTSRMNKVPSLSDSESDRLRKDILRSLTPVPAGSGELSSRELQNNGLVPEVSQRHNALRESSVIPREYESYWAGTDSAEGSPGEQDKRHNPNSAADNVSKNVPSASEFRAQGAIAPATADVRSEMAGNRPASSSNRGIPFIDNRFSWEENNVQHHNQSMAISNPSGSSMVNQLEPPSLTIHAVAPEFASSGTIQPLQAHTDTLNDADDRNQVEHGTRITHNEERPRPEYNQPSTFRGVRPSEAIEDQSVGFHEGESERFKDREPVQFSEQEPMHFNQQEPVEFRVQDTVISGDQGPVSFNGQQSARIHDVVKGTEDAPRVVSPVSWSNRSSPLEHPNQYNRDNTSTGELLKVSPERRSGEISDMSRDPHFPAETENRSETETSTVDRQPYPSVATMDASGPISQPKLTPFKEIMAMQHPNERINVFRTTRNQFAALNTGLDDWLAYMVASHSEDTVSMSSPKGRTIRTSGFAGVARQKISPSLSKFTRSSPSVTIPKPLDEQFPDSAAQFPGDSTAQQVSTMPISAQPDSPGKGRSAGGQLQNKGKDLLQSAGLVGGKASQNAKNLFAKGKSRLRGSTDKAPLHTPPPASPQSTDDKQGMQNSFRGSFSSTPQVDSTYETLDRSSLTSEQDSALGGLSEPLSYTQTVRPSSLPLQRVALSRDLELQGTATELHDVAHARAPSDEAQPSWDNDTRRSLLENHTADGLGARFGDSKGQDSRSDLQPPFRHAEVSEPRVFRPLIQDPGDDADNDFGKGRGVTASPERSGIPTQAGTQERRREDEAISHPEYRNSQVHSHRLAARSLSGTPTDINASESITTTSTQVGAQEPLLNFEQTQDMGPWADWPTGDSDVEHSDIGASAPLNDPASSSASSVGVYGARGVDLWDHTAIDGTPDVEASTPRNEPESSGASSVGVYGARGVDLWDDTVFDGTPDVPSFPVPAEIESDKDLFEDAPEMISPENEENGVPPSHAPLLVDEIMKPKNHIWGTGQVFNNVAATRFSVANEDQESWRANTRSAMYREQAPVSPPMAFMPVDAMSAVIQPLPPNSEPDYRQQLYTSRAYHKSREYLGEQPRPYAPELSNNNRHGPGYNKSQKPIDVFQERSQMPSQSRTPVSDLGSQDVTPRAGSSQTPVQSQRTNSRSAGGRSPSSGPVARLPSGVRHGKAPSHGTRTASFGPRQQDTEYELPGVGPPPMDPVTPTPKGRRSPFGRLNTRGSRDHVNEAKKAQIPVSENTRINPRLVADRNASPSIFDEDEVHHETRPVLMSPSRTPSKDLLLQFDGEVMSQRSRPGSRPDLLPQASSDVIPVENNKSRSKLMRRLSSGRGPQRSPSIATPDSDGKKRTSFFGNLFGRSATVKRPEKSNKLLKGDPRSASGPLLSKAVVPSDQSRARSDSARQNTIGSIPSPYDRRGSEGPMSGNLAATAVANGVSGRATSHQRSASQPLIVQYNPQPAASQPRTATHGRGAHVAYLQSQDIFPMRNQAQPTGDQVTRSLSQKAARAAWSHPTQSEPQHTIYPTYGTNTPRDSGGPYLSLQSRSPAPAPALVNRLSGRYADATPNQPLRTQPPQGGQSVHPSLVNQLVYDRPPQGSQKIHSSPANQPWAAPPPTSGHNHYPSPMRYKPGYALPPHGAENPIASQTHQPWSAPQPPPPGAQPVVVNPILGPYPQPYTRSPQGGQSVNPTLTNQKPLYTGRLPQGGQSVHPSLVHQPGYDPEQQQQQLRQRQEIPRGDGSGRDAQLPRLMTTAVAAPVRSEYGNQEGAAAGRGWGGYEDDDDDEEIVMSPTFYPGQEWRPKGLEG